MSQHFNIWVSSLILHGISLFLALDQSWNLWTKSLKWICSLRYKISVLRAGNRWSWTSPHVTILAEGSKLSIPPLARVQKVQSTLIATGHLVQKSSCLRKAVAQKKNCNNKSKLHLLLNSIRSISLKKDDIQSSFTKLPKFTKQPGGQSDMVWCYSGLNI